MFSHNNYNFIRRRGREEGEEMWHMLIYLMEGLKII
jgi:hypothetical protein